MKQSDVEVMVKIVNNTINAIHLGEIPFMSNEKILIDEPHKIEMRIIKRLHYASNGKRNGFVVSINLNTDSEFFDKEFCHELKYKMFVGWSLCDNEDRFDKSTGTKIAVIRALKLAKTWLNLQLNCFNETAKITIDDLIYNVEFVNNNKSIDGTVVSDQIPVASSIYHARSRRISSMNSIIQNSMKFIKNGKVIIYDNGFVLAVLPKEQDIK